MSQENVDLVLGLTYDADVNMAEIIRDDEMWATATEAPAGFYHPDFKVSSAPPNERTYTGMDGLRDLWLDWLAPWATYRVETQEAIDVGDRVLLPAHNYGRLHGSTEEVKMSATAVFPVRGGKITRVEYYATHDPGFKAVGPEE